MAFYESITYSRQDAFDIEPELRSDCFELEQGESAAKIAYHLCGKAALIGEFVISEEGREELLQEARRVFRLLCQGKKNRLDLMDGRILVVACVLLARNSINAAKENDQDSGEIWKSILEGLHFPEISEKTGCSAQVARNHICDALKDPYNVRFFSDAGQKYYNTLRLHALAPEWAIKNLYNVLYAFYHKNLECSYDPESNVATLFVSAIRRRWVATSSKEASRQSVQSDRLSSGLRELFVQCPRYMAAVCDALLEKIDRIAQGDLTGLKEKNRWDVLLLEWYEGKTAYEKSQMSNDRRAAVRRKVVDRKEQIRPEYRYENNQISLSIPGIRLPEIQQAPVLQLYQNDQLILSQRLSIYGNEVLWSTRAHRILLNQIPGLNWKKRYCFMLRILAGEEELYCSGSDLYREYFCFTPAGNETRLLRCNQMLRLIVRKAAKLVIDDPENHYTEEAAPYRSIGLWTDSVSSILLNGAEILEDNQSGQRRMWAYLTPEYDPRVCARSEGKTVSVYSECPTLHVVLPGQADGKNYQITIDDTTVQLYQFPWENGQFRIQLPPLAEYRHTVQLKDFDTGSVVFQRSYTIIPGLVCAFDRPFYPDRETEGKLQIRWERRELVHSFLLEPGMDQVTWNMAGLDFEISVPKVYAEICEKNAFYLPENTWYEDLKDAFLTIRTPEEVNSVVIFGNEALTPNHAGHYEIGTAMDNRQHTESGALLGLGVVSKTWKQEWELTNVCYQERFGSNPIRQEGRRILWNPLAAGFVGSEGNASFCLKLENDQQDEPFRYVLRMRPETVERNFPCRTGTYSYTLWLTDRKKLFSELPDLLLLQGEITVEDPPEDRFEGKYILLTRAYYSDPLRGSDVFAKMKHDGALIDDIRYEGVRELDGNEVHEYSGLMFFKTAAGWKQFSDEETDLYEKINPVFFTLEGEDCVRVYLEEDDPLMLNTKTMQYGNLHSGVQIYSRKNELTRQEQSRYLAFADKFKFIERDN